MLRINMGVLGRQERNRDKYIVKGTYIALSGPVAGIRVDANGEVCCWQ